MNSIIYNFNNSTNKRGDVSLERTDLEYVTRCFRWLTNELVIPYMDNKLPSALKTKIDTFYDSVRKTVDWDSLTRDNCLWLGFMNSQRDMISAQGVIQELWLIPQWLIPIIPEGMYVEDVQGNRFQYNSSTCDKTTQFGVLSYGVVLDITE